MCNLSSELGVLEDNWATCQPFSLCHCVVPLDYHLPCIHRCVLADIWAYYWAIITFATVGYGDLHAYNEVEAAFIIIFVFLNIVINAWIVGEFLVPLDPLVMACALSALSKAFEIAICQKMPIMLGYSRQLTACCAGCASLCHPQIDDYACVVGGCLQILPASVFFNWAACHLIDLLAHWSGEAIAIHKCRRST